MRVIFLFVLACSVLISCDDSEGGWLPPQNDGGGWLEDGTDNGPTSNDKGDQRPQGQNTDDQKANVIRMRKEGGVYLIPVKINGVDMEFIFDTGASLISISLTEANFLYKNGSLKEEDILKTREFQDAQGDISEGTIINLHSVKLGTKTLYNVQASVVHNLSAPLLMGQSALSKFGTVTIDNANGTITLAE